jgi:hypothetical protein
VTRALVVVGTFAVLQLFVSYLSYRFPRLRPALDGEPMVIVQTAKPIERNMRRERLTFDEAIVKNLKVMDATALTLCRDQKLPICVLSIFKTGALKRVILGEDEGTLVHN